LAAVLAEFPYQSAKRGRDNFNGEVPFANSMVHIWCRHLATYLQKEQARNPLGKFDYSKYAIPENIAKYVTLDIEEQYKELKAQASETHLIDNAKFGQFLAGQFAGMEQENEPTKQMLIHSPDHTVSLALRIKDKEGKRSYVVNVFDPNTTTTHTHGKASSLQTVEMQTIEDYLVDGEEDLLFYYPEAMSAETKGLSMIYVCPPKGRGSGAGAGDSGAGRTLTTCVDIKNKDIDTTIVWNLMTHGFSGNLRQLDAHLKTLTMEKRIELLSAKNANNTPALYRSMQEGHADVIRAYGELLASIPMPERIKLLAGKDESGTPALYIAMHEGHADAIKAYGELLASISMPERIGLLAGKADGDGIPALFIGMQRGGAGTIKAYSEFLKDIPEKDRIELLIGKSRVGIPALHTAICSGNAETVKTYGELLKNLMLSADQQVELLLVKDDFEEKESGLHVALNVGKFGVGAQLLELLEALVPDLSPDKRAWLREELNGYEDLISQAGSDASAVQSLQEWSKMKHAFSKLKTALSSY
jgi:hypothetical protein